MACTCALYNCSYLFCFEWLQVVLKCLACTCGEALTASNGVR